VTPRTIGRIVGALFLLAFAFYLAGGAMVDADPSLVPAGGLLMLVNSAAVVGIGVLAFPVLRLHSELSAHAYLVGRVIEGVMLTVGIVFLLSRLPGARDANDYCYQIAMISVSAAGMLFCRALSRGRLVPRFLAIWGVAGYFVFLVGSVLEVLGYDVGLVLSVPGGLFEVFLGLLLVVKGFTGPVGAGSPREPGVPVREPR
jgi:hypothetical protein